MPQSSIPCCIYRGGTSRGLMFHDKDLPIDDAEKNRIFLEGIDAYNLSQVNGIGGSTSSTSKVCVISPPSVEGCHANWTFYQVGTGKAVVDSKGTCGNMMSAVGAFIIDEGLAKTNPNSETATVYVYNTNIKRKLEIKIPLINGRARVSGNYAMPGVLHTGAMIEVAIVHPGGEMTGQQMLLGHTTNISTPRKTYTTTFSDLINPFIFLAGENFGLTGTEQQIEVANNQPIIDELNLIRDKMAVAAGMAINEQDAHDHKPNAPKIAIIAPAQDYRTTSGTLIKKESVDILIKAVSMGKLHRTCPASGLYNLAAVALLENTVANKITGIPPGTKEKMVRIGHPDGIVEVKVKLNENGTAIESVGMERTARRIVKGHLFIPPKQCTS